MAAVKVAAHLRKVLSKFLARQFAQLFPLVCAGVFVSFTPREAVKKISVVFDNLFIASRGVKLTKTPAHTRGNSSANCLARNLLSTFLKCAAALITFYLSRENVQFSVFNFRFLDSGRT